MTAPLRILLALAAHGSSSGMAAMVCQFVEARPGFAYAVAVSKVLLGIAAFVGAVIFAVSVTLARDAILAGLRRGWLEVRSLRTRLAEQLSRRTRLRFVPPGSGVEQQIDVDLRPQSPINIEFSTEIPQVSLWFNISNRSSLDLVFDRMLIEIWVGQPTIYSGSILRRFALPAGETEKDVYFPAHLAPPQQEQIKRRANEKGLIDEVSINLTAYFQSERGWFEVRRHIDYRDVLVKGLPTPETKAQLPVQQTQSKQTLAPPQQKQYSPQPRLDQILTALAARQERQKKRSAFGRCSRRHWSQSQR